MKRFHVHISVNDLERNIQFYSSIFGSAPTVQKPDYAKWMLEDPRINFAISRRGHRLGVNHLGLQVDSTDELTNMRASLELADASLVEQTGASCCYARSDKYWVTDPQGIAWETFHSLGAVPVYGEDSQASPQATACCVPSTGKLAPEAAAACCAPTQATSTSGSRQKCCS